MELDLKDYIKILRKRIWLIVSIVLVACLATGIVSFMFMDPSYEASTKIIVNKQNERVGADQIDLNTINMNIRLIDTYKEIIKTKRIMDKVVQGHPELNLTRDQLIQKVKVSSVNNTQVMTLAVQDESYAKAADIVNAVSKVFKEEIPSIYMGIDNVSILNEANRDDNAAPVKPNKKLNVAISFVVSLIVAFGLAFLLEYLDDTIKTEADVAKYLELPTLAMVTKIGEEDLGTERMNATRQVEVGEQHATAKQ
ncbi:YveK family protein [Paenibacillus contaminans]|uniref:Lipopolysaccharide biosynthesis protein n=1 Tax=Paenibacillus contaminans TaxID=450362 RepID=A0A329M293_9BACL|nr:Wzz/FepE/Etk N-terminal domain-containing protein [Paenibacillus contaminans]RAV13820.1 lipopolysaccharide biosynthesis protein [Paenibacillus contaminans]